MIDETFEIYRIQRSSIKFITIHGIVNIECEDEERKMKVDIEVVE